MSDQYSGGGHYRNFTKALSTVIKSIFTDDTQKKQVDGLVKMEKQFKQELL